MITYILLNGIYNDLHEQTAHGLMNALMCVSGVRKLVETFKWYLSGFVTVFINQLGDLSVFVNLILLSTDKIG